MWVSDQVFLVQILAPAGLALPKAIHILYYVQPQPCVRRVVHSINCVLLMVRLTQYIVHLGGAFEVSTTRIQIWLLPATLQLTSPHRDINLLYHS